MEGRGLTGQIRTDRQTDLGTSTKTQLCLPSATNSASRLAIVLYVSKFKRTLATWLLCLAEVGIVIVESHQCDVVVIDDVLRALEPVVRAQEITLRCIL